MQRDAAYGDNLVRAFVRAGVAHTGKVGCRRVTPRRSMEPPSPPAAGGTDQPQGAGDHVLRRSQIARFWPPVGSASRPPLAESVARARAGQKPGPPVSNEFSRR